MTGKTNASHSFAVFVRSLVLTAGVIVTTTMPANAAGDWIKVSAVNGELKSEKRAGNIATSVQCRNNPQTTNRLDAQVKFTWKPNTSDTEWIALIFSGVNHWKPGYSPSESQQWKKVSGNRFATSSGAQFGCSIWHHKTGKASRAKARRPIHSSTSTGFRSISITQ